MFGLMKDIKFLLIWDAFLQKSFLGQPLISTEFRKCLQSWSAHKSLILGEITGSLHLYDWYGADLHPCCFYSVQDGINGKAWVNEPGLY